MLVPLKHGRNIIEWAEIHKLFNVLISWNVKVRKEEGNNVSCREQGFPRNSGSWVKIGLMLKASS